MISQPEGLILSLREEDIEQVGAPIVRPSCVPILLIFVALPYKAGSPITEMESFAILQAGLVRALADAV